MKKTTKMNGMILAVGMAFIFTGCARQVHQAVRDGNVERVSQLLDSGSDVNAIESSGAAEVFYGGKRLEYTPLHWAAFLGDLQMVKLLISKGADLNPVDHSYGTPLHLAAEQARVEVVKFLLNKGARVNVSNPSWGHTPLHRAAWGPVVSRFGQEAKDLGADPNPDYKKIIALLVAEGAEINVRDHEGETPLDQAIEGGSAETVTLLKRYGGKTSKELKADRK
jgi:ankyrin repeat protein